MTKEELRAKQAPLKEKYKQDPASALVVHHSSGDISPDDVNCTVETFSGKIISGLHPAAGGDGSEACSGDMLLDALVACAGVTFKAVSLAMGIQYRKAEIRAEGDLDFRGTLAVSKDVPVGFKKIRMYFDIDSDEEKEKLDKLIELTERYCVVYQTLKSGVPDLDTLLSVKNPQS
ncbi:MAG: OsmC family protein [Ignavibacteriae bacterium]|nr:OsmC family protein [Ignavibacteriota bacterium]